MSLMMSVIICLLMACSCSNVDQYQLSKRINRDSALSCTSPHSPRESGRVEGKMRLLL